MTPSNPDPEQYVTPENRRKLEVAIEAAVRNRLNSYQGDPRNRAAYEEYLRRAIVPEVNWDKSFNIAELPFYNNLLLPDGAFEHVVENYISLYSKHPSTNAFADKLKSNIHFPDITSEKNKKLLPITFKPIKETDNAWYHDKDNSISTSNLLLDAVFHEAGHAISNTYGLKKKDNVAVNEKSLPNITSGGGYYEYGKRNRLFNIFDDKDFAREGNALLNYRLDPYVLHKLDPINNPLPKDFDGALQRQYNKLREEIRASEFGARLAAGHGMSPEEAYNVGYSGYPTYVTSTMRWLGTYSPEDWRAIRNNMLPDYDYNNPYEAGDEPLNAMANKWFNRPANRMPAPRPVYNITDQARAIEDYKRHEMQRQQHPYIMKQWGERPEGFENEGLWVPGMVPITEAERRLHDYAYGNTPGSWNNVPYQQKSLLSAKSFDDMRNGVLSGNRPYNLNTAFLNPRFRTTPEQDNELLQKTRTWRGYDTIADRASRISEALVGAESYDQARERFLNVMYNRAPLYVDKNSLMEDWEDFYQSARNFYHDRNLPTPQAAQGYNRLVQMSPAAVNRQADKAKAVNQRRGLVPNSKGRHYPYSVPASTGANKTWVNTRGYDSADVQVPTPPKHFRSYRRPNSTATKPDYAINYGPVNIPNHTPYYRPAHRPTTPYTNILGSESRAYNNRYR